MCCYTLPKKLQATVGEDVTNRWFFHGKKTWVISADFGSQNLCKFGQFFALQNLQTLYVTLGGPRKLEEEKFGGEKTPSWQEGTPFCWGIKPEAKYFVKFKGFTL